MNGSFFLGFLFLSTNFMKPQGLEPFNFQLGIAHRQVLHHVFPDNREQYVLNVHRMLRPSGKYFSLCFSENDLSSFGGSGKFRTTPLGTTLYFSSEGELRELFEPLFKIEKLRTMDVRGKKAPHTVVEALMSKKDV